MARIEARLREAGAQPVDAVPKVVRGLAPPRSSRRTRRRSPARTRARAT